MANVAAAVHRRFRRGRVDRPLRWPDGTPWPSPTLDRPPAWLGRAPPDALPLLAMAPAPDAAGTALDR
ncbi:protein of unknown function (plasmid) [Methylorubrum extorquens DM4]|uniref:Uncharacterized protein n=1 Tax=Methylorubrum extorquens (strain DSM 6343 / CIP 106787 / DM4) TaxID=661410 RepID=C7CN74_METED|nr:protein of unknown function [Methylorubrum extorquens DM4]